MTSFSACKEKNIVEANNRLEEILKQLSFEKDLVKREFLEIEKRQLVACILKLYEG